MKYGRSLQELAIELDRQAKVKKDYVATAGAMQMTAVNENFDLVIGNTPFQLNENAHRQLGLQLKIPAPYYERMRAENPGLLMANVNGWFQQSPDTRRMVRTLDGTARAILSDRYGKPIDQKQFSGFEEISGHGISVMVQGKKVLAGNSKLMESEKIAYAACDAVGTKFYVAADGSYVGCILIADEVKPDSKCAIAELKKIGVEKTVMLTGDDERIGKSVADELGLDAYYAQLLPDQKVEKLEMLDKQKRQGSKLAFVGDGINDAPVLARADVGIAMGGLGSDAAIEAADVVLMTDEPSKLVEAIDVAKATKRIVMQNIVIALGIKSVFLVLGALGMAGMWEAVFGDVGVTIIAVLNAMRILKK